ncbi:MAG: DUF2306 domain-containing protein [Longimicrobiales bacterium]|nr:DUF2306 domain-containing protein [Longimicrobiales bacterium]
MADALLLRTHVVAAALAILIGIAAMAAPKRPRLHPGIGRAYFWTVTAVNLSGAYLAVADWDRNGWFLSVAILTQALAVVGWVAGGRPGRTWLTAHAVGMVGSYVEIWGAFLVNNWIHITGRHGRHSPEAFLIPGAVGAAALLWLAVGIHRGRLPRSRRR